MPMPASRRHREQVGRLVDVFGVHGLKKHLVAPQLHRESQLRGHVSLANDIHVLFILERPPTARSLLDQQSGHRTVTAFEREIESSLPVVIPHIQIRPFLHQQAHGIIMASLCRPHERRPPLSIDHVHGLSPLQ
eukprot:47374-Eustigmatos_ZCMA.PRE.1